MPAVPTKLIPAALLALSLAACNTTQGLLGGEPSHVAKVDVSLAPSVGSPRFAQSLDLKLRGQAGRFGREGAAKQIRVAVTEVHYKNAMQAILIGDGNYASAEVSVVDAATGQTQGLVKADAIDSSAINGMAGALISATQDKAQVDERLADRLAWNVLVKLYGPAAAKEAGKREPAAIEPVAEPIPPDAGPKTKPAGSPVVSSTAPKDRAAMATPAAAPVSITR